MRWWERYVRSFVVNGIVGILILLCTVSVAFIGLLSQISYLAAVFPRLYWLEEIPESTLAILQEVLSACLMAAVMVLFSFVLYLLISQQGTHSRISIELSM